MPIWRCTLKVILVIVEVLKPCPRHSLELPLGLASAQGCDLGQLVEQTLSIEKWLSSSLRLLLNEQWPSYLFRWITDMTYILKSSLMAPFLCLRYSLLISAVGGWTHCSIIVFLFLFYVFAGDTSLKTFGASNTNVLFSDKLPPCPHCPGSQLVLT